MKPSDKIKEKLKQIKAMRASNRDVRQLSTDIQTGNSLALSKAITLVESSLSEDQALAHEVIQTCLSNAGKSIRIGITGVPGVGKSSLIEALGNYVLEQGHKLAVLAIDPTSERSGGSILGDKTRMESLSNHPNAFIRPTPTKGSLGGVARKTRESILLCEAAGYDVIFIETVGVGQSETAVHYMVDFFLLLMLSGAGDELQGIKRGIMEMADALFITKADGDNLQPAKRAMLEYKNALHLFPPRQNNWIPKTGICSAQDNTGMDRIWEIVNQFFKQTKANAWFEHNRKEQDKFWLRNTIQEHLLDDFYATEKINAILEKLENRVHNNEITAFDAADQAIESYFNAKNQ